MIPSISNLYGQAQVHAPREMARFAQNGANNSAEQPSGHILKELQGNTTNSFSPFSSTATSSQFDAVGNTGIQTGLLQADAFSKSINGPVRSTLVNGSHVFMQQAPNKNMSHLAIQIPLRPEYNAIKLLLSEVLLNGSPQTKALVNHYASQGVMFGVTEFDEHMQFNVQAPVGKEQMMVQAAFQVMSQPQIDDKYFVNLKANLMNMIDKVRNKPDVMLAETLAETMYGQHHPYAKTFQAALAEINHQTPYSMLNLYRSLVSDPNRLRFSWVSPRPFDEQVNTLNQAVQQFGRYRNPYFAVEQGKTPPITPSYVNTIVFKLLPNENLRRSTLSYAWHAPKPNSEYYLTFRLLEKVMAGMSSDFFQVLRNQRGLVYSTQRRYNLHKEGADFTVTAQVDFPQIKNALMGFNQVRQNLSNMNVTPEELFRAKKMLILELRDAYQSVQGANLDTTQRLEHELPPIHPDQLIAEVQKITLTDLATIAQKVFSRPPVVGIAAPKRVLFPLKQELAENQALSQ